MVVANNRLELLPDGPQLEIEQYLSPSDKVNLAIACKATSQNAYGLDQNGYFEKDLGIDFSEIQRHVFFNSRSHAMQKNLKQAGLYILTGKKDEALAMIDKDPGLLLQVIPSITLKKNPFHVGEKHIGRTLFQLALGTYDPELYEAIGQRIEAKYGHDVKAKQFNEQFPNGVKSTKSYRADFDALIKTMAADTTIDFVDGQNIMNDKTKVALQALKDSLLKLTNKCTTGVHFDLQIVIDVIEAWEEGFDEFQNENKRWDQRALYWRCVFGLIESFMSHYVAMALNEQKYFYGVMEGSKKVTRSTVVADGSDFFDSRLGDARYIIDGLDETSRRSRYGLHALLLRTFCQAHQKNLENLSSNCSNYAKLEFKYP